MTLSKRTAEFAHLFELFDKLASRRSRNATNEDTSTSSTSNDIHSLAAQMDLEPVFHNLANIVGSVRSRTRKNKAADADRSPSDRDSTYDEESAHKFPMGGKDYRFTFKMMLHKLYEVEDWGRKVKEILEKSQNEFKPLAEREETQKQVYEKMKRPEQHTGPVQVGVEFGLAPPTRIAGRGRSHTVTAAGGIGKGKSGVYSGISTSPIKGEDRDDMRAVKKRCIGRRKSMSGLNAGAKPVWFYEAAAASIERNERSSAFTTPTALTRPSRNYGALQGAHSRKVVPRRRVSSVAAASAGSTLSVDTRNIRGRRAVSVATRGNARNTAAMA